jgi:hypothetical protein
MDFPSAHFLKFKTSNMSMFISFFMLLEGQEIKMSEELLGPKNAVFPTKKISDRNFRKIEIKSKFRFRRKISAKIEMFCLLSYGCLNL